MESGSREPSVREGSEEAATRGAAVEGGREATAGLGWAYIPGDSCPSFCLLPAEEGGQACFPSKDPTLTEEKAIPPRVLNFCSSKLRNASMQSLLGNSSLSTGPKCDMGHFTETPSDHFTL